MPRMKKPRNLFGQEETPDAAALDLMGGLGLPAVLISQLSKAERIKALMDLVVDSRRWPNIAEALEWMKARNPRVMAHNQYVEVSPIKGAVGSSRATDLLDDTGGLFLSKTAPSRRPSKMMLDPVLEIMDPAEIVNTIAHEATHGAQRLVRGKKKLTNEYLSQLDDFGYGSMPLEQQARKMGTNRAIEFAEQKAGLRKPRK